jgi:hypothetical protein
MADQDLVEIDPRHGVILRRRREAGRHAREDAFDGTGALQSSSGAVPGGRRVSTGMANSEILYKKPVFCTRRRLVGDFACVGAA